MSRISWSIDGDLRPLKSSGDLRSLLENGSELRDVDYEPRELGPDSKENGLGFKNVKFTRVRFSHTIIRQATFRECRFDDCLFIGTSFIDCEFHRCEFQSCNTHKCTFHNTYIDPTCFEGKFDSYDDTNVALHLFQQLLSNSAGMNQIEYARHAEYLFRRWLRYQAWYDATRRFHKKVRHVQSDRSPTTTDASPTQHESPSPKNGVKITLAERFKSVEYCMLAREWFPNLVFDWISGYGLRPWPLLVWTPLVGAFVFAVNLKMWSDYGVVDASGASVPPTAINVGYFTVAVLTTLGFSTHVPTQPMGFAFAAAGACLGLLWFALITSVIVKRVLR